ncbi:MAG: hypothetical protein HY591_02560 [Candidatus Omnitrophica bacterium]|nr:hypothetical protein [Candidatus Omnitrophota bacterium]
MRIISKQVLLGARVSSGLKQKLSKYCETKGVRMNFFVAQAIEEKLEEMAQDQLDIKIVQKRLKSAQFVTHNELQSYLHNRGIKQ